MEQIVREAASRLTQALRESNTSRQYKESAEALKAMPDVFQQVMELRARTIEIYQENDPDVLLADSDRLARHYDELQRIPEVSVFLEAEEELVATIQAINSELCHCVDLYLQE